MVRFHVGRYRRGISTAMHFKGRTGLYFAQCGIDRMKARKESYLARIRVFVWITWMPILSANNRMIWWEELEFCRWHVSVLNIGFGSRKRYQLHHQWPLVKCMGRIGSPPEICENNLGYTCGDAVLDHRNYSYLSYRNYICMILCGLDR